MIFLKRSRDTRANDDPVSLLLSMVIDGVKQISVDDEFFKTLNDVGKVLVTLSALDASNKISIDEAIRIVRELVNSGRAVVSVKSAASLATLYLKLEGVGSLRVEGYIDKNSFDVLQAQRDRVLLKLLGVAIDTYSSDLSHCPLPRPAYSDLGECSLSNARIVCREKQPELVIMLGKNLAKYLSGLEGKVSVRIGFALKTPLYLAKLSQPDVVELTPFISILAEIEDSLVQVGVYPNLGAAVDVFAGRAERVLSTVLGGASVRVIARSDTVIVRRKLDAGYSSREENSGVIAGYRRLCTLYSYLKNGKRLNQEDESYLLRSIIVLSIFPPSCGFESILARDAYEDSNLGLVIREPELVSVASVSSDILLRARLDTRGKSNKYLNAWLECLRGLYNAANSVPLRLGDLIAGASSASLRTVVINSVYEACKGLLEKLCQGATG